MWMCTRRRRSVLSAGADYVIHEKGQLAGSIVCLDAITAEELVLVLNDHAPTDSVTGALLSTPRYQLTE